MQGEREGGGASVRVREREGKRVRVGLAEILSYTSHFFYYALRMVSNVRFTVSSSSFFSVLA